MWGKWRKEGWFEEGGGFEEWKERLFVSVLLPYDDSLASSFCFRC